ncbi:uncharacterized protein LOC134824340 [Bolinopsis microptera]|uniref:uncharacterized protein LOC134824340 n=1 Tax=Bolinopsis microptera TaxID=2820187 RepID=UPI00307A9ACE
MSVLNRERRNFLKSRLVQNVCEEYSTGSEDNHKIVRESMAAAKLKTMININHCGQRVQLGNINEKDLDVYCKPEEVTVILRPVIEEQVASYKQTIDDFCGATEQRSPSSIIQNNCYLQSRIANNLREIEANQLSYVQNAGKALRLYDKVAKQRTTPEQKEKHLERVTSLSAAATKLNLMVANLEANILSDTYTAENVSALKVIHAEIEAKQRTLEKERSHAQHMLDAYLALGDEFTSLVELYSDLRNSLETYQWALSMKE